MHYILSRNDVHDVFGYLREFGRSKRLREKVILYKARMHQKVETRRRRGISRADVRSGGGVWGIWSGMETVRIPGQKCEVIYLQLKR